MKKNETAGREEKAEKKSNTASAKEERRKTPDRRQGLSNRRFGLPSVDNKILHQRAGLADRRKGARGRRSSDREAKPIELEKILEKLR